MSKRCEQCGAAFTGHRESQRFCSVGCSNASRPSAKKKSYCASCGIEFVSKNRGSNRGWTRFCSVTCGSRTVSFKGGPEASRRRRRYGMEPEEYEALLREQDGCCALCRGKPDYSLYVDHDHETKKTRSLLCARCNNAVGVFDRLTWDEVLIYWGYSNHHDEGKELARLWFAQFVDSESGNVPSFPTI